MVTRRFLEASRNVWAQIRHGWNRKKKVQTLFLRLGRDFPACRRVKWEMFLVIPFNPPMGQLRPKKENGLAQRAVYLHHHHMLYINCAVAGALDLEGLCAWINPFLLKSEIFEQESPHCRFTLLLLAKSLQSCPTLCDPIDGSPPGSPVPGILQAKTLEWVAISFSYA